MSSVPQLSRSLIVPISRRDFGLTLQEYNGTPVAPGVAAHSIIAVENPNDPKEEWNDEVVEYKSAHVEPVKSEFIVHWAHPVQDKPEAIEEVRRILLEHLWE